MLKQSFHFLKKRFGYEKEDNEIESGYTEGYCSALVYTMTWVKIVNSENVENKRT